MHPQPPHPHAHMHPTRPPCLYLWHRTQPIYTPSTQASPLIQRSFRIQPHTHLSSPTRPPTYHLTHLYHTQPQAGLHATAYPPPTLAPLPCPCDDFQLLIYGIPSPYRKHHIHVYVHTLPYIGRSVGSGSGGRRLYLIHHHPTHKRARPPAQTHAHARTRTRTRTRTHICAYTKLPTYLRPAQ